MEGNSATANTARPGRATSRYIAGPQADRQPVFNGPVRKWKKKWVTCQSKENRKNNVPPLLLHKWTVVDDEEEEEPPKRRFRYYPIASLEKEKAKKSEKVSNEVQESKNKLSSASYETTRAVDGIFDELCDVDASFQKMNEDEYNLNESPRDGSHTGGNESNNCFGAKKMMINWEGELQTN